MSRKLISWPVEPFNDVFYKGCFFNSVFPALTSFGKPLWPYLINDVIVFDAAKLRRETLPDVQYVPVRDVDEILAEEGILCDVKRLSTDVVTDLKQALNRDRPALIWVDCFYESVRTDAYQKHHWEHTLLFHGYDDELQQFHVIEHQHRENLSYQKMTIPYLDVERAYQGFLERFYLDQQYPTFFEFHLDPNHHKQHASKQELQAKFAANVQAKSDLVQRGLRYLPLFANALEQGVQEQAFSFEMEALIASLNNLINTKQVEKYRVHALYEPSAVTELIDTILEHWTFVRATVVKYHYSGVFRATAFEKSVVRLRELIELETQFVKAL